MGTRPQGLVTHPGDFVVPPGTVGVDSLTYEVLGAVPSDPESVLESYGPRRVWKGRRAGQVVHEGYLGSRRVTITEDPSTILSGSGPKALLGTNALLLGTQGVQALVEHETEVLRLPADQVRIGQPYTIHVAADLHTAHRPVDYISAMVEVPRMRRVGLGPASIVFKERSGRRELAAYDKGLELGDPDGPHRLRLEARFNRRLKQRFGGELYVEDLWDEEFFATLRMEWQDTFLAVRLEGRSVFPENATPAVLRRHLAREALSGGGAARVLARIDAIPRPTRPERRRVSSLRSEVRDLLAAPSLNAPSEVVSELRLAIYSAAVAVVR